jgi:hypothetical protein
MFNIICSDLKKKLKNWIENQVSDYYRLMGSRCLATCMQKRSCVHIENFDKNENMVNLGHLNKTKLIN